MEAEELLDKLIEESGEKIPQQSLVEEEKQASVVNSQQIVYVQQKTPTKKKRIGVFIAIALVVLFVMFFAVPNVKDSAAKTIIQSQTENVMSNIKNGLTAEEYRYLEESILNDLISEGVLSVSLAQTIYDYVDGQDIADIYNSLMYHMRYKVESVEKVDDGKYVEVLVVQNVNLKTTITNVVNTKLNSYSSTGTLGKIIQGIHDLNVLFNGDFSKSFAEAIINEANYLANNNPNELVTNSYKIAFYEEDGEWKIALDDESVFKIIKGCMGMPE